MAVIISDCICEGLPVVGDVALYTIPGATISRLQSEIAASPWVLVGAKKIFLHVGTHDVDNGMHPEDICEGLIRLRGFVQSLAPTAKVYISGMLPRLDQAWVQDRVKQAGKLTRQKLGPAYILPRRFTDKHHQIIPEYFDLDCPQFPGLYLSPAGKAALWTTISNAIMHKASF